jgi:GTP cyclohydrolase IA
MENKLVLTNQDVRMMASNLASRINERGDVAYRIFGVPRGGVPAAYLVAGELDVRSTVVDDVRDADIIVDDVIDSGATRERYAKLSASPFYALIDKTKEDDFKGRWVEFPWERTDASSNEEEIILRLLQYIGEDPKREGLEDTPKRVLKAWKHWTSGYGRKPEDVLKVFKDGAKGYKEMIVESPIPFFSMCEHHMAPFFGTASIGYIPDELGICGLSKIPRVLDIFARRLQVQERLTVQTADALVDLLKPYGVGVVIKARHLCMESRGIQQAGVYTTTSAMRGAFLDKERVRHEFLTLIK